ncbi:MAG: cytochrome c [Campylobacterales bacterium]|nr:cytochrome c [Campylobacterales bacterium]
MPFKIFLLLVFLAGFSGCSSSSVLSAKKGHKFQSKELKKLMTTLNISIADNYKSELEKDDARLRKALRLSDDLKSAVLKLNVMEKGSLRDKMSREDLLVYRRNTGTLYKSANEIEEIAKNYEAEKLDPAIERLKQSCLSCHAHFGVSNVF